MGAKHHPNGAMSRDRPPPRTAEADVGDERVKNGLKPKTKPKKPKTKPRAKGPIVISGLRVDRLLVVRVWQPTKLALLSVPFQDRTAIAFHASQTTMVLPSPFPS